MLTNKHANFSAIKQTNIKDEQFSASFAYGSKEVKLQSFEHQEASKTSTMFGTAFTMSSSQKFVKEETSVEQFTTSDLGMFTSFGKRRPSYIQDDIKIIQDLELIKVRLKGPETTNISDEDEVSPAIEKTIELLPQKITLPDVDVAHDITLKTIDQTEVSGKVMMASKSRRFSTHTEEASAYIQVAELKQGGIEELELGMNVVIFNVCVHVRVFVELQILKCYFSKIVCYKIKAMFVLFDNSYHYIFSIVPCIFSNF